jgi:hypothetical protein
MNLATTFILAPHLTLSKDVTLCRQRISAGTHTLKVGKIERLSSGDKLKKRDEHLASNWPGDDVKSVLTTPPKPMARNYAVKMKARALKPVLEIGQTPPNGLRSTSCHWRI